MKKIVMLCCYLLLTKILVAQEPKQIQTGRFSGPFSAPLLFSSTPDDLSKQKWSVSFRSFANEDEDELLHTKEIKALKNKEKLSYLNTHSKKTSQKKTRATNATIGVSFRGNDTEAWTPTDNSIAVSNDGIIVSCNNQGIAYYDTLGKLMYDYLTWDAFINNSVLNQAKFDPRVLYDAIHDRFIVTLLHGFSSTTSRVLICFSKTNNPMDGWNIYRLTGNPYQDTSWTDYPTIGITNDDLFINGNRFGDAPNYNWKKTYIYQVGLNEGYQGNSLQFGLWDQLYTPDGNDGITLYPASNGQGKDQIGSMYFVEMLPDSGSHVYLFEINGSLASTNKTLTSTQYAIPHYDVCADAFEKNQSTGGYDSLSTGSSWTQNAFYLNRIVHFSFDADIGFGWCGLHYGRIYLDSNKAVVTSYGELGTDMAYPAIASFGYDSLDKSVAMAFVRSDSSITPEVDVITLDDAMTWSNRQIVKTGDTMIDIVHAAIPERWGDYSGMCRKQNNTKPQAWLAAGYGNNARVRKASIGTWITQVSSNEPTSVNTISSLTTNYKLFPNPAHETITIEFENKQEGMVSIDLYSITGSLVRNLFNDFLKKSINQLSFNKLMLSKGNYIIKATRNKRTIFSTKLTIDE